MLDVRNPFFTDVARGAEDARGRSRLSVMLGNSDESSVREAAYLDLFEEQRVHGVLISPFGDVPAAAAPALARHAGRARRPVSEDGSFSSVAVDDVAAATRRRAPARDGPHGGSRSSAGRSRSARSPTVDGARRAVAGSPGATLEKSRPTR